MSEHDLAVLITDVKESLEREIQGLARERCARPSPR
jgi:hypothetical protein